MGAQSERRGGQFGNSRGVPDKQARNRRLREDDPRHQAAAEEVRANQEMIDRLAAQTAEDAERSAAARALGGLTFVKPEQVIPEPTQEPVAPRITDTAGRRFVDCHCGHNHANHTNPKAAPACVGDDCNCPGYRPHTAPDPLDPETALGKGMAELLRNAMESTSRATVRLAQKIAGEIATLRDRVNTEIEEREANAAELARTREARERVERLEKELAEAREAAGIGNRRKKPAKPKPAVQHPELTYPCPTCDKRDLYSPQARGAHRSKAHGFRKGDDEK